MNVGFRIPNRVDTEPPERTFDLRQYLNFVWRNWMFIASVTAFVFLIGVIYLVRATPLYTATTQVLLERAEKAPTDTGSTDSPVRRLFVHRKPACNPQVRLAAAKGRHQGAARSAATECKGTAEHRCPQRRSDIGGRAVHPRWHK